MIHACEFESAEIASAKRKNVVRDTRLPGRGLVCPKENESMAHRVIQSGSLLNAKAPGL